MPQVDVQWPSENEDFDATTDSSQTKTSTKPKPLATKVAVNEPQSSSEEQTPPATPADETPEEPAAPETPQAADEPAAEEPVSSNQPDPNPIIEREAANLAASVDNDPGAISQIPTSGKKSKMPSFSMGTWRLVGEVVLVVAFIALGLWSWSLYNDRKNLQSQVSSLNSNPQAVVQRQTQQLITKIGSLMQLPTGETPTVAEVSDASQARQQSSFFANAQNGDRVLMYVKAGEAILYRPSTNKIVLVAPLVFTNTGSTTSSSSNKSTTTTPTTSTGTTSTHTTGTTTGH